MKAHLPSEPRCALLWNIRPGTPEYRAIEHAAAPYRLRLRPMTEADLGLTVGALCAGRAPRAGDAPRPSPTDRPAIIVSGLRHDTGDLGRFIDGIRAGGGRIPLRAMVTQTSRTWTLDALLRELCREHQAAGGSQ